MYPKTLLFVLVVVTATACSRAPAQKTAVMDPNDIQIAPQQHSELPPQMLERIRATTDVFESIDGISYDAAVNLYKRDVNPEENLIIWEEMVRAYKSFCRARCNTPEERRDVYRTLLLRTMFTDEEALARSDLKVIDSAEAMAVMQLYSLSPKPIGIVQEN